MTAATAVPTVACGDDASPGDDAAETASQVCDLLVQWSNDLTASMDGTAETIADADDPTTANNVLVDGYDEMIDLAEGHIEQVDDLQLPDGDTGERLEDELTAGAEEAVEQLERGRAEAEELEPIDVDGQAGAIGGAMDRVESAHSVVEPDIGAYDEVLQQAFRDEPDCRDVIRPS